MKTGRLPSLKANIIALGALQGANYLIPLISLPYLARVLGPEGFGKVAFIQIVMQYLIIFTDYGFFFFFVKDLSIERYSKERTSQIFMSTWCAQWLLFLAVVSMLALVVCFTPSLQDDFVYFAAGTSIVFGAVLFPLWLFNGLERFKEVALLQIVVRLLMLIPLFLFVTDSDDIAEAILVTGFTSVISGLLGVWWIQKHEVVSFVCPEFK
ncbi:MAG: oligosaccharide flippase family protein, partial [Pseudomonadales bacterium]|nr:oligosaccharide flippase family protein [Pseudomonadales bacterium]